MAKGDPPMVRFWRQVDMSGGADACWNWTGCTNADGYGWFNGFGGPQLTHRLMYSLGARAPERGQVVMHSCDNPPCCNPAHLRIGTDADNARDRMRKGRGARGERQGNAMLTEAAVVDIVTRLRNGEMQRVVAEGYGLAACTISALWTGRSWTHVTSALGVKPWKER